MSHVWLNPEADASPRSRRTRMRLKVRDAFRRINEIMDEPAEPEPGTNSLLPDLRGKIKVDHLFYNHDLERPPILKDVSLVIPPGTMLAVIGPSGSSYSMSRTTSKGARLKNSDQ